MPIKERIQIVCMNLQSILYHLIWSIVSLFARLRSIETRERSENSLLTCCHWYRGHHIASSPWWYKLQDSRVKLGQMMYPEVHWLQRTDSIVENSVTTSKGLVYKQHKRLSIWKEKLVPSDCRGIQKTRPFQIFTRGISSRYPLPGVKAINHARSVV